MSFYLQKQRIGRQNMSYLGIGRGRIQEKGVGRWIWYKYYGYMYIYLHMRPIETNPGMGGRGIKKNDGEWIQLWYIVNVTLHPQHNNNKKFIKQKNKLW
jgi:hypothetical protein